MVDGELKFRCGRWRRFFPPSGHGGNAGCVCKAPKYPNFGFYSIGVKYIGSAVKMAYNAK